MSIIRLNMNVHNTRTAIKDDFVFKSDEHRKARYAKRVILKKNDKHIDHICDVLNSFEPIKIFNEYVSGRFIIYSDNIIIQDSEIDSRGRWSFELIATSRELLNDCYDKFDHDLTKEKTCSWFFTDDNGVTEEVEIPLKVPKKCTANHVPWLGGNVDEVLKEFNESDSSILILLGPPGTGKSSLINYYISEFDKNPVITYDKNIMRKDSFYINYISHPNRNLLVLEDADSIIQRTNEGRSEVLSKILNVGDGILDVSKKKIIITANIDTVEQIDSAIARKGRCFGVYVSRALTAKEANRLANFSGLGEGFTKSLTLAEFYNGENQIQKVEKFGFAI